MMYTSNLWIYDSIQKSDSYLIPQCKIKTNGNLMKWKILNVTKNLENEWTTYFVKIDILNEWEEWYDESTPVFITQNISIHHRYDWEKERQSWEICGCLATLHWWHQIGSVEWNQRDVIFFFRILADWHSVWRNSPKAMYAYENGKREWTMKWTHRDKWMRRIQRMSERTNELSDWTQRDHSYLFALHA